MDEQILVEIARLVRHQSTLMVTVAVAMVLGFAVMSWELYGVHKALEGVASSVERVASSVERIAVLTAEVLRRTP